MDMWQAICVIGIIILAALFLICVTLDNIMANRYKALAVKYKAEAPKKGATAKSNT
jgi:hypothetical protein